MPILPSCRTAQHIEDLNRHRNNGWSLFGLAKSLEAQGKSEEAAKAMEQFKKT
jgi:hypothetical protein